MGPRLGWRGSRPVSAARRSRRAGAPSGRPIVSAARSAAIAPDGVDVALDVAGSGVLPELIDLAVGAHNVVTLADFDGAKQHKVRFSSGYQGHAFHALAEIGALIAAGRFWLPVERTYPLDGSRKRTASVSAGALEAGWRS